MNPTAWIKAEQQRREILTRFAADQDEGKACAALRKAAIKVPDFPGIHQDLVHFAARACEYETARQAARRLLKAAPENPAAVEAAAGALTRFGAEEEAVQAWQRLARNAPHRAVAWTALARLVERGHRLEEAREWITKARRENPRDAQACLVEAGFSARAGRLEEALAALHPLIDPALPPAFRYQALYQWGNLHDAMYAPPAAAAAWREAKRCVEAAFPREVKECRRLHGHLQQRRQRLAAGVTPERIQRWRKDGPATSLPPITLLMGHPRSGTTLLEQVLAAHPWVVDIDEENALAASTRDHLFQGPPGADEFAFLEAANHETLTAARQDYLRRVSMLKDLKSDTVILDKNPNLTDFAPFLLRPFPDLKLLVARRDPRDIALSCYRQAVRPDYVNISWLDPAALAADCRAMLEGWERLRDTLGPDGRWLEIRYEDLCTDLPRHAREATAFLGLAWHPDQETYRDKRAAQPVASPTWQAVRAPVHTRAIGRWERYADLLPELFAPWD